MTEQQKQLIQNYPKMDGHRRIYARYPVQEPESGKWYTANVFLPENGNEGGYEAWWPKFMLFDTEEQAQRGCDVHNRFYDFTEEDVNLIVSVSMSLACDYTSEYCTGKDIKKIQRKSSKNVYKGEIMHACNECRKSLNGQFKILK